MLEIAQKNRLKAIEVRRKQCAIAILTVGEARHVLRVSITFVYHLACIFDYSNRIIHTVR